MMKTSTSIMILSSMALTLPYSAFANKCEKEVKTITNSIYGYSAVPYSKSSDNKVAYYGNVSPPAFEKALKYAKDHDQRLAHLPEAEFKRLDAEFPAKSGGSSKQGKFFGSRIRTEDKGKSLEITRAGYYLDKYEYRDQYFRKWDDAKFVLDENCDISRFEIYSPNASALVVSGVVCRDISEYKINDLRSAQDIDEVLTRLKAENEVETLCGFGGNMNEVCRYAYSKLKKPNVPIDSVALNRVIVSCSKTYGGNTSKIVPMLPPKVAVPAPKVLGTGFDALIKGTNSGR